MEGAVIGVLNVERMEELTGVMRTMLLPLMGRYSESKKPGGLIHDD
jgi:O-methyltransferase involved in polyketide biosynthesis